MPVRVYLMPSTGTGATIEDAKRPKYRDLYSLSGIWLDYGPEPVYLVVTDVDAATHAALAGTADVTAVPDLAQNVGAQLASVQAALDGLNIPSQWVTAGMSYGSLVRYVAVLFFVMEQYGYQGGARLFGGAVTLATRWSQLSAGVQNTLKAAAAALRLDTSAVTANTTVRQLLKGLADQWPAVGIAVGGVVL